MRIFETSLVLNLLWIEEALGDLHVLQVLDEQIETTEALGNPSWSLTVRVASDPEVRDAWNQAYKDLF